MFDNFILPIFALAVVSCIAFLFLYLIYKARMSYDNKKFRERTKPDFSGQKGEPFTNDNKILGDAIVSNIILKEYGDSISLEECSKHEQNIFYLYNYLKDDIFLTVLFEGITYDCFKKTISDLEDMGLGKTSDGHYIPISAFCFTETLMMVSAYIKGNTSEEKLKEFLVSYFK